MTNFPKPNLTIQTNSDLNLLDLAAANDLPAFAAAVHLHPLSLHEPSLWYSRNKTHTSSSIQMILEERTPLMVAATYGSTDVIQFILSLSTPDVTNLHCGSDRSTALHCAASGASPNAVSAVNLLLSQGADVNSLDVDGLRPADVIAVSPNTSHLKFIFEELLGGSSSSSNSTSTSPSNNTCSSPMERKREFPIDPSVPDIKNSLYSTDEFRMFSFKIRPCSRAYSHDWTECPFVHPGENARRRDPRKFHYSCVPCPEFRKGACRRGDLCEYAHGVFECWLHPAQYRTRLCKDGVDCGRRVCFFAHTADELRPLYVSTGSAVPSPRGGDFGFSVGSPPTLFAMLPTDKSVVHLPGTGRLRSSLSAREEMSMLARSMRFGACKANLGELFAADEMNGSCLSPPLPRYNGCDSPTQKLSLSPRNPLFVNPSVRMLSRRRLSPRSFDMEQMRSLSSRELGLNGAATVGSPLLSSCWSNWGSPNGNGNVDWGVNGEELGRIRRSMVWESGVNGEEPDVSWVQSLVNTHEGGVGKECGDDDVGGGGVDDDGSKINEEHAVLGAWLEQMQQLDQLVA